MFSAAKSVAGTRAEPNGPELRAGFSLLEMMVALAVAGILFFVALPGYQHAVVKAARAAARATLLEVMARQEQYFINNKRYAPDLGALGLPATYFIDKQGDTVGEQRASYRISLELTEGEYGGARAVPLNRQAVDSACMTFSLSRRGVRAVSGSLSGNPAECW
jgi:type IV pilus assembly protein PilE